MKRPGTHDRDVYVAKTPPKGIQSAPEFICEDVTGQYSGPALAEARSRRPTDERIGRLEQKHDKLVETVGHVDRTVAGMVAKLDTALEFIKLTHGESHKTERTRIGSRAKVLAALFGAVGVAIGAIAAAMSGCA